MTIQAHMSITALADSPLQRITASPRPASFSKSLICNEWLQVPLPSRSIVKPIAAANMSTATSEGILQIERVKCLSVRPF